MKYHNIKFEPWFELYARRRRRQQERQYGIIRTAKALSDKLRKLRHDYLGSGFPMDSLVRDSNEPHMDAVAELSNYLSKVTYAFLDGEYREGSNGEWCKDWCDGFYYYTTMLFAHGLRGTVDDYILMADAYEKSANTIHIVYTENLPGELGEKAGNWVMENEAAPLNLTRCVQAAIAVLMGAMPEPDTNNMEEE